jgi:hypothetical protein
MAASWRRGRQIILERTSEDNPPLDRFIRTLDPEAFPRVKGTAVYLAARHDTVPYALADNLRHNKANALGKASVSSSFTTLSPGGFLPPIPTIGAAQPSILSASMSRPLPSRRRARFANTPISYDQSTQHARQS